jgi:hypothetical protein
MALKWAGTVEYRAFFGYAYDKPTGCGRGEGRFGQAARIYAGINRTRF